MPQKICVVEATFTIKGRGLVVITKEWQAGQVVSREDWIELRSDTGGQCSAQVKSIDSVRRSAGYEQGANAGSTVGLCLIGISGNAVQAGDEIWSVGAAD